MARILVTDGEQRSALAIIRALGRAGHHVAVTAGTRRSLAGASRYAAERHVVPDAAAATAAYVDAIVHLCEARGIDVLIPVTDQALSALLAARERIRAAIPWPDADAVAAVADKYGLQREAREVGMALPEQTVLETPAAAATLDRASLRYPIVVKPSRSVRNLEQFQVQHASDAARLGEQLAALSPNAYPVLLQQRIVGPGVGVFLLVWDGDVVASFSHRRLRENPPSGGSSVYCESIAADPALVEMSRKLLERFCWRGVAMVEFKVDAATGTPCLLEINGRFWGSLQLAVDAGVNFPVLLVALASGGRPAPVRSYRPGNRLRSFWRDLDHFAARMRWSAEALSLPPDAPTRGRLLLDFLRPRFADRLEILRLSDPGPFVIETLGFLRARLRRPAASSR